LPSTHTPCVPQPPVVHTPPTTTAGSATAPFAPADPNSTKRIEHSTPPKPSSHTHAPLTQMPCMEHALGQRSAATERESAPAPRRCATASASSEMLLRWRSHPAPSKPSSQKQRPCVQIPCEPQPASPSPAQGNAVEQSAPVKPGLQKHRPRAVSQSRTGRSVGSSACCWSFLLLRTSKLRRPRPPPPRSEAPAKRSGDLTPPPPSTLAIFVATHTPRPQQSLAQRA